MERGLERLSTSEACQGFGGGGGREGRGQVYKLLSDPASVPVDCPLLVLVEAYRLFSCTWDAFYHLCSSGKILAEEAMKPLRFITGCNTKSFLSPSQSQIISKQKSSPPSHHQEEGNRYIFLPDWPVAAPHFTLTRLGEHFQGA